ELGRVLVVLARGRRGGEPRILSARCAPVRTDALAAHEPRYDRNPREHPRKCQAASATGLARLRNPPSMAANAAWALSVNEGPSSPRFLRASEVSSTPMNSDQSRSAVS